MASAVAGTVSTVLATICSLAATLFATMTPAIAGGPIQMTIGTGVDPAFSQFYVAKEARIFARNGLEVTIKTAASGSAMIPFLIGNQIQAAYGSDVAGVVNFNVDDDIVAVADGTLLLRWLSVVGVNARSLDDLKGKRIGITRGTSGEVFWQAIVKKYNLNPADYTMVNNEAPEEIAALMRSNIDAFVGWEPWPSRAVRTVKDARVIIDDNDLVNNRNYVFMSRKWITGNPDAARRFMQSMVEATDFINDRRDEAAPMVAKSLKMPLDLVTELMPKVRYEMSWSEGSLQTIQAVERQLRAQGTMKGPLDWNRYVDVDLVREVRPDWVTITRLPPH